MLLLLYTDEAEAVAVAEDIRVKTAAQKSVYEDKTVSVTMTFGVTEFTDTDTFETVIDRADANLYYGKKHGKNCVVH